MEVGAFSRRTAALWVALCAVFLGCGAACGRSGLPGYSEVGGRPASMAPVVDAGQGLEPEAGPDESEGCWEVPPTLPATAGPCSALDRARLDELPAQSACAEAEHSQGVRWSACPGGVFPVDAALGPEGEVVAVGRHREGLDYGPGCTPRAAQGEAVAVRYSARGQCLWVVSLSALFDFSVAAVEARRVTVDAAGNPLVTVRIRDAYREGLVASRAGDEQPALVKLDRDSGRQLWSRFLIDRERPAAFATDVEPTLDAEGNVYLAGGVVGRIDFEGGAVVADPGTTFDRSRNLYVAKLGPDGGYLWHRELAGALREAGHFRIATRGDALVVGTWTSKPLTGLCGPTPIAATALFSLSTDGDLRWSRAFAGDSVTLLGLDLSPDGRIAVAGSAWSEVDFGGGELPLRARAQGWVALFDAGGRHVASRTFAPDPGMARPPQPLQSAIEAVRWNGPAGVLLDLKSWGEITLGAQLFSEGFRYLVALDPQLQVLWAADLPAGRGLAIACDGRLLLHSSRGVHSLGP